MMTTPTSVPPAPRPPDSAGSGSGVWWRALGALFVVATLLWGTYHAITLLAHGERVERETFAAADVDRLVVDSSNGSVRIIAAHTDDIVVRAEISDGLRSTGEQRTLTDGVLELRASCPVLGSNFCSVDYEVVVPDDVPITVAADNGRVEVSGSDAAIDVNGDNGRVVLRDLSGPLVASTDNGRVEGTDLSSATADVDSDNGSVVLSFAVPPTAVEATTDNGSVEVVVPDDGTAYRLDMATANGDEEQSVLVDPASDRVIVVRSDNGRVTVRTGP